MKASSTVVIWGRATIAGSTASFAETQSMGSKYSFLASCCCSFVIVWFMYVLFVIPAHVILHFMCSSLLYVLFVHGVEVQLPHVLVVFYVYYFSSFEREAYFCNAVAPHGRRRRKRRRKGLRRNLTGGEVQLPHVYLFAWIIVRCISRSATASCYTLFNVLLFVMFVTCILCCFLLLYCCSWYIVCCIC